MSLSSSKEHLSATDLKGKIICTFFIVQSVLFDQGAPHLPLTQHVPLLNTSCPVLGLWSHWSLCVFLLVMVLGIDFSFMFSTKQVKTASIFQWPPPTPSAYLKNWALNQILILPREYIQCKRVCITSICCLDLVNQHVKLQVLPQSCTTTLPGNRNTGRLIDLWKFM